MRPICKGTKLSAVGETFLDDFWDKHDMVVWTLFFLIDIYLRGLNYPKLKPETQASFFTCDLKSICVRKIKII